MTRTVIVFLALAILHASAARAQESLPTPATQVDDGAAARGEQEARRGTSREVFPNIRIGDLRLEAKARFQGDLQGSGTGLDAGETTEIDFGRRRVGVQGRFRRVSFELSGEVGTHAPWRDVWAEYRLLDGARIQVGQFKTPFSLDAGTGGGDLDFIRRSRVATQLGGTRDRGVMVHGRLWRRFEYETGVFRGDGEVTDVRDVLEARTGRVTAVRVVVTPWAASDSLLRNLQMGVAATAAELAEGISGVKGRTVAGSTYSESVYWVQGARRRGGLEARWRPGPFGVAAEYIHGVEQRRGQGRANDSLAPLSVVGWYVTGTWIVTGERKTGNVTPRRSVLQRGLGAVEVTGRLERFVIGDGSEAFEPVANPRADLVPAKGERAFTAGVNWYPHRWLKLQVNLVHETLTGAVVDPASRPQPFISRAFRVQFAL